MIFDTFLLLRNATTDNLFVLFLEVIFESDSLLVVGQDPLRVESGLDALVVAALLAVLLALGEDDAVAVWNK